MAIRQPGAVLRHLRRLVQGRGGDAQGDKRLLEDFVARRDEAAFAELVRRHGPMVLGVCRRVLAGSDDAEDAFQATFLVLVRKAASLRNPDLLGNWLYGVACRTARAAKVRAAARRRHEREATAMPQSQRTTDAAWDDVRAVLDEEIGRLPEKYRAPLVLCYLEGKTHQEAARSLRVAAGSISWRLRRGCDLLRQGLTRRGVVLSTAALAGALAGGAARAAVPVPLIGTTVTTGLRFAAGTASGAIPAQVTALTEGVLKAMSATKLNTALAVLLTLAAVALGAGALAWAAMMPAPPDAPKNAAPPAAAAVMPPRTDLFGDPLPAGAVTRLGTVRFRSAHTLSFLAFSDDGKLVIGSGWDDSVQVWDRATGRELHRLQFTNEQRGGFAIAPDGKAVATGGRDKDRKVRVWDVATGKVRFESEPLEALVWSLRFSPDGKTLASGAGKVIQLWDAVTGKELARMTAPADRLNPIAFSPDGKTLAAAGRDNVVRLWDWGTGKELRAVQGPRDLVYAIAFSPDGKTLAAGGADKEWPLRLWDVASGEEVRKLAGPSGWVRPVAFAPDGKTLATAGQDGKVRLLDVATGEEHRQFAIPGQDDTYGPWIMALAFAPDGKTLAAAGNEHVVRFWDLEAAKEIQVPEGHRDGVTSVAFAANGRTLVTTSGDKTVRLWDTATGKEVRRLDEGKGGYSCASFSPDGKLLAAVGPRDAIVVWDPATGKELHRLEGHKGYVSGLAFSPDGKTLASSGGRGGDGKVRIWDAASGKELRQIGGGEREGFNSVAFAPDGTLLAAGLGYSNVVLLDPATGKEQRQLHWEKGFAASLAFSPDGRVLASTGGLGNAVHLWDVASGQELRQLTGHPRIVNVVVFSPDGRTLASAGQDNTVRLWDAATGTELKRFTGHLGQGNVGGVVSLAFSPDGRIVASAGDDTTALLWDVTGLARDGRLAALRLDAQEVEARWADLAGDDAARAHDAVWTLAAAADQAVPLVREKVRPVAAADAGRVARLVADLDSAQFAVREKAQQQLEGLGESAGPGLKQALRGQPSAEVRRQVEGLLGKLEGTPPERLRQVRAVAVLEHAATPEARQVLETLAKGIAEARVTREAKAALERLGRREGR